jgi:hypothetical protein
MKSHHEFPYTYATKTKQQQENSFNHTILGRHEFPVDPTHAVIIYRSGEHKITRAIGSQRKAAPLHALRLSTNAKQRNTDLMT